MGRLRLEPEKLKKRISIRLEQRLIDEIKKNGTLQQEIEKIVTNYYKSIKK